MLPLSSLRLVLPPRYSQHLEFYALYSKYQEAKPKSSEIEFGETKWKMSLSSASNLGTISSNFLSLCF